MKADVSPGAASIVEKGRPFSRKSSSFLLQSDRLDQLTYFFLLSQLVNQPFHLVLLLVLVQEKGHQICHFKPEMPCLNDKRRQFGSSPRGKSVPGRQGSFRDLQALLSQVGKAFRETERENHNSRALRSTGKLRPKETEGG